MNFKFWDKRNQRSVNGDQLMRITLVDENEQPIGSIGYKSEKCPHYQNWDMWCKESDLELIELKD